MFDKLVFYLDEQSNILQRNHFPRWANSIPVSISMEKFPEANSEIFIGLQSHLFGQEFDGINPVDLLTQVASALSHDL